MPLASFRNGPLSRGWSFKKARNEGGRRPDRENALPANGSATIHTLPDDVLFDIFCVARDSQWASLHSLTGRKEFMILTILSHVDRRWRAIVMCTPLLWTSIYILLSQNSFLWTVNLQRSGNHSIQVRVIDDLCVNGLEKSLNAGEMRELLHTLTPHLLRISVLHIRSQLVEIITGITRSLRSASAPLLEELSIERETQYQHFEPKWTSETATEVVFNCGAPVLTTLTLHGVSIHHAWPPLHALTTLRLHIPAAVDPPGTTPIASRDFRVMLLEASHLRHLDLSGVIFRPTSEATLVNPVEMPFLETLNVKVTFNAHVSERTYSLAVFFMIIAVSVQQLALEGNPPTFQGYLDALSARPVEHQFHAVRSFTAGGTVETLQEGLLRTLPTVSHLTLKYRYGDCVAFLARMAVLTIHQKDLTVLPMLETMTVDLGHGYGQDRIMEALLAFVKSRVEINRPLEKVHLLHLSSDADSQLIGSLCEMVNLVY